MDNNFSQEDILKIIEDYQNNVSIEEIMTKFNSDEHDIRCILKDNKIDRGYRIWSKELEDRVVYYYSNKIESVKNIIHRFVISSSGLDKVMKRRGVDVPKRQKYSVNEHYFDNINTSNKAYILGFLYSDGCNFVKTHTIRLQLQDRDKEILEQIKHELQYSGPLYFLDLHNPRYYNQYALVITDRYLSENLEKYGMVQNKSLVVNFPNYLEDNYLSHFIRGLFDGDGCISWNKKRKSWYVGIAGTLDICNGIGKYMDSINCKYVIRQEKRGKNCYTIEPTSISSRYIFLSNLYNDSNMCLKRKYNKFLSLGEEYRMKVLKE